MLVDSHCHLNFINLQEFNNDLGVVLQKARENGVTQFLCVCVELSDYPDLCRIAETFPEVKISVGLHPNNEVDSEPDAEMLVSLAKHPSCIAIGETGLDYYRSTEIATLENQKNRFREHIQAAITSKKPLIIHTRQAAEDTMALLDEEDAAEIGGVMHCFSESWEIAKKALDLGFYISFSGIVTFKNAQMLQEVARKVPLDRILIETDAPYLAPTPFRGKQNHPALVKHVAEYLAQLRQLDYVDLAQRTTHNYQQCFKLGGN